MCSLKVSFYYATEYEATKRKFAHIKAYFAEIFDGFFFSRGKQIPQQR
jgi:hypothetical protein